MILQATDFSKQSPCIYNTPLGEDIQRQLLHIYAARGSSFEHAVEMTGRLYTTLALFIHSSTKNNKQNTSQIYVQKGIEYISANYSYPITVEDIAAYVGITAIANSIGFDNGLYFSKAFHKKKGISPKEYRNKKGDA